MKTLSDFTITAYALPLLSRFGPWKPSGTVSSFKISDHIRREGHQLFTDKVLSPVFVMSAGIAKFDERTAHLLMMAANYMIIPSRFEPCGLVAQSAARYGTIPIVTAVGGLKDFVTDEVGPQHSTAQHSPARAQRVGCLLHCTPCAHALLCLPAQSMTSTLHCRLMHRSCRFPLRYLMHSYRLTVLRLTCNVCQQVGYRIEPFGDQHSVPAQRKAVADLLAAVRSALGQHDLQRRRAMQEKCIALDLSWDNAAAEWENALVSLCQ